MKRVAFSVSFVGLVLLTAGLASAQGVSPGSEGKTAEQVYKNITALQGTPANELNQSMHLMKGALGVDCLYCHIEREWEKDVKPPKQVARMMISMMMDINKRQFGGRQVVTCYTCHNGRPTPADMPIFPVLEPAAPSKPVLPTVDQILTKYVQALGGEQAMRKVNHRAITGTQFIPTGPGGTVPTPAAVERYLKAPNLAVTIYRTPTYAIAQGFDGKTAWSQDQAGRVSDAVRLDTGRAMRAADFYEPLNLKQEYAQLTVVGIEKVKDRDAYVVVGVPQGDTPERLYFDTQSGLLLRKQTVLPTPIGNSPFLMDFEDYRDTGSGVKFPFLIQMNPANPRTELAPTATLRVTKVDDNAPIEDARFVKPEPRPAAGR
jgi:photosynthetic reaction center cytochrome c subunit